MTTGRRLWMDGRAYIALYNDHRSRSAPNILSFNSSVGFQVSMVNRFSVSFLYLASGPAWQAVARVHRDAYGVAGTLVAAAIFLSGEEGSLDQVGVYVSTLARAISSQLL